MLGLQNWVENRVILYLNRDMHMFISMTYAVNMMMIHLILNILEPLFILHVKYDTYTSHKCKIFVFFEYRFKTHTVRME